LLVYGDICRFTTADGGEVGGREWHVVFNGSDPVFQQWFK
jgi:hypothetical protein